MADLEQYKSLLSEIIQKQAVILGPEIAVLKARNIEDLVIADDGEVTDIKGDPDKIINKLVDIYVALAGQIVKNTLSSIFEKYSSIKKAI